MAKYNRDSYDDFTAGTLPIAELLLDILNEKAEANRLKRTELEMIMIKEIDPAQFVDFNTKRFQDHAVRREILEGK